MRTIIEQEKTGIYCLANDRVLDWMIAFLESVRTHEPKRRVVIIPFDDNISKLSKLSSQYNFEFFDDSTLKDLDRIGATLRPQKDIHIHRFRTFAVFWGPLEHFVFFDSDIVILDSLEELFQAYFNSKCDFMYYYGGIFNPVYKAGYFRDKMIEEYSANGFNAGSFLSSKGVLTLDELQKLSLEAVSVKQYFADHCIVQPFFNYCVDIKRLKTKAMSKVIPNLGPEWAKFEPIERLAGNYQVDGKRLIYTHWAGLKHGPNMPNRKLFLEYRLKSASWLRRFQYRVFDWLKVWFWSLRSTIVKPLKTLRVRLLWKEN
jgi:hypothetical protein